MSLSLLNPWVILGLVAAFLLSNASTGTLLYIRGKDDQIAYQNTVELKKANKALADAGKNQKIADAAGVQHEKEVQIIHERGRDIIHTVNIPPDADPFVPVWFVRLFDRLASRSLTADAYPGQPENNTSDIRLSEVRIVLGQWADKYYTCQKQIIDINQLNPVLPPPPEEKPDFLHRINPF